MGETLRSHPLGTGLFPLQLEGLGREAKADCSTGVQKRDRVKGSSLLDAAEGFSHLHYPKIDKDL